MSIERSLPTYLADAKSRALDAEAQKYIAALASAAVKTVAHAVGRSPNLATRLARFGTLATNRARVAANAAAEYSGEVILLLEQSGIDYEKDDTARQIASMAHAAVNEASSFFHEAEDSLQIINQMRVDIVNIDICDSETIKDDRNTTLSQPMRNEMVWS